MYVSRCVRLCSSACACMCVYNRMRHIEWDILCVCYDACVWVSECVSVHFFLCTCMCTRARACVCVQEREREWKTCSCGEQVCPIFCKALISRFILQKQVSRSELYKKRHTFKVGYIYYSCSFICTIVWPEMTLICGVMHVCDMIHSRVWHIYKYSSTTRDECNTLQHTATYCNILQHTVRHCNTLQTTATHCKSLQHTATQCIEATCTCVQHIDKYSSMTRDEYNTPQHTATRCSTLQHTTTHCSTLQHTATHCNTL